MDVTFSTQRLAKLCSSSKKMRKEWGKECAEKLQQRLVELEKAADTLEDMRRLPSAHCHELSQNRKGQLAVDLKHPYRLIFKPDHEPAPEKSDGGLDWTQVTRITVLEVVDYH